MRLHLLAAAIVAGAVAAQAQGLLGVHSTDGVTVWAVGAGGAVIRSTDGGGAWGSRTVAPAALRSVTGVGTALWAVGDQGVLLRSTDAGGGWQLVTVRAGAGLRAVRFASDRRGWIAGEGGLLVTTSDGGTTWVDQPAPGGRRLNALSFSDTLNGFAAGDSGTVLRTQNGGVSWTAVPVPRRVNLLALSVAHGAVYVTGEDGTGWRSTDGGGSWIPLDLATDSRSDIRGVHAFSPDSVLFLGAGGAVRISHDAGRAFRWGRHPYLGPLASFHFASRTHGWACSDRFPVVLRTTDGGATWQLPAGTTSSGVWQQKLTAGGAIGNTMVISPADKNRLYVALGATIFMSTDRGDTWRGTASAPGGSVHSFYISPKDTNLYVVASTGGGDGIRRSTNRGQTWTTTILRSYSAFGMPLEMDGSHPDTLYYAPEDSYLYRSTNFGATWDTVSRPGFSSPCDFVVVRDSSNILWCGDSGPSRISRSTDAGLTWTLILNAGSSEIPTIGTGSLDNSAGYATVWGSGGVRRTGDFGASWTQSATTGSAWGCDVAKDDPDVVSFGVYGGGQIYISTNAGGSFAGGAISGSNYAVLAYDRSTFLAQQSGGMWKYSITYTVPIANVQSAQLIRPNGGEVLTYGQPYEVTWSTANVQDVRIEYLHGGSKSWETVAASVPAASGSFIWSVPNTPWPGCRLRIMDAADGDPADTSNGAFAIVASSVAVNPAAVAFGSVRAGTVKRDTLRISNAGTGPLVITSVTAGGAAYAAGRTSFVVPAGASDTLAVLFLPDSVREYRDTLRIASNAPGSPVMVPLSGTGSPATGVGEGPETPAVFALEQNYPNPFNPATVIRYSVGGGAATRAVRARLAVFDLLGREVAVLVDGVVEPGAHSVTFDASGLASGVYLYRLSAAGEVQTRRLVLLR
jgi:photosystem II stability/assembly factor-like uncharacterized protein